MFSLHTQFFFSDFFFQVTRTHLRDLNRCESIRIAQTPQADDKIEVRTSIKTQLFCDFVPTRVFLQMVGLSLEIINRNGLLDLKQLIN